MDIYLYDANGNESITSLTNNGEIAEQEIEELLTAPEYAWVTQYKVVDSSSPSTDPYE